LSAAIKNLDASKADHKDIASVFSMGSVVAAHESDLPRGIQLARQAVVAHEALGETGPSLAMDLNNLGTFMRLNKQLKEAVPILERAVAVHRQAKGSDDETTARMSINFALSLIETDEADRALDEIAQIFETCHRNRFVEVVVEAFEYLGEP